MLWVLLGVTAITVAEVSGYYIHRFIHKPPSWFLQRRILKYIAFVSSSHMGHHALSYGPKMLQRPSRKYFNIRNPNGGEFQKRYGWLSPEFLVPTIPVLAVYITSLCLSPLGVWEILYCLAVTGGWVAVAFLYMHDAYHKADHWLLKLPLFGRFFRMMRRAHDLHHSVLENNDLPYNLGIMLPFMDMLHGTWKANYEGVIIREETGEIVDTPFSQAEYDEFYGLYGLTQPPDCIYADKTIESYGYCTQPPSSGPGSSSNAITLKSSTDAP